VKPFFDSSPASSVGDSAVSESVSSVDLESLVEELSDTSDFGNRGEIYFAIQSVLILLVVFPAKGLSDAITTLGFLCFLGGGCIIAAAVLSLGDSLSPLPKPRADASFVTDGMYEYVRHPMYSGLILSCLGLGVCTNNATRIAVALCLLLLLDKKATKEEEFLVDRYGDKYIEYRRAVKKLIPYLY